MARAVASSGIAPASAAMAPRPACVSSSRRVMCAPRDVRSIRAGAPGASTSDDVRYLDIHEEDALDGKRLASWIRQAAKLPGW
jgi:hypothetical protein